MSNKDEMFLDHLSELRKRFFRILIFFVIIFIGGFYFVPDILDFVTFTSKNVELDLNVFNITDPLYLYMKVSGVIAFIATFPYLILELWLFIAPGLTKKEKGFFYRSFPLILFLFISGVAFAYFVLVPYYIMFSNRIASNTGLTIIFGAREYLDFLGGMLLPFGLIFQLPVLIYVLSKLGIISSKFLKFIRSYAYFGLLIASAFITPPDPLSMGIVMIPMALLYESSVFIASKVEKNKNK